MTDTPTRPTFLSWPWWWAEYKSGVSLFIYARGQDKAWQEARKALPGVDVESVRTLPYPTGDTSPDGIPGYCYQPHVCAGLVTCPRADSCAERRG